MTLAPLLADAAGRPTVSFELFPARSEAGRDALWRKLSDLLAVSPDFVSVTFGAAGATRGPSRELLAHVLGTTAVPAMAHLTCVGSSRRQVVELASEFLDAGVRNVLALRGDPPAGAHAWTPHPDGIGTARDLVQLLQVADRRRLALRGGHRPVDEGPLTLSVAAFPRGGAPELAALRAKQDAGAHFAICQVTFSADEYATFVRRAREAGITIPLLPGIAVTDDAGRLHRIGELTGVPAPHALLAALDTDDAATRLRASTAFASGLARGLLDAGAPGLHLYTFNAAAPALDLIDHLDLPRNPRTPLATRVTSDHRDAAVGGNPR